MTLSTQEKGLASEAKAISYLVDRGFTVLEPFGDNERYDIVIEDDGEFERIQVKTGKLKDSYIDFKLSSNRSHASGVTHKPYTSDEVDSFIVVCHELEELYYVPIDDVGSSSMRLRLKAKQEQPQINWAEEYEIDRKI